MNATKMTLIATLAALALYFFAMLNSVTDNSNNATPESVHHQTNEN